MTAAQGRGVGRRRRASDARQATSGRRRGAAARVIGGERLAGAEKPRLRSPQPTARGPFFRADVLFEPADHAPTRLPGMWEVRVAARWQAAPPPAVPGPPRDVCRGPHPGRRAGAPCVRRRFHALLAVVTPAPGPVRPGIWPSPPGGARPLVPAHRARRRQGSQPPSGSKGQAISKEMRRPSATMSVRAWRMHFVFRPDGTAVRSVWAYPRLGCGLGAEVV